VRVNKKSIKTAYSLGLGVITTIMFIVLSITGILEMFYYVPSIETAYFDIILLQTQVPFGQLLRNMHRWGAHLMVLTAVLHMVRVFYTGAYKRPREFNWVVGVVLLILTLGASFTGYLLPWDQLAFWAITVGTRVAAYEPLFGKNNPKTVTWWPRSRASGTDPFLRPAYHGNSWPFVIAYLTSPLARAQRWWIGRK